MNKIEPTFILNKKEQKMNNERHEKRYLTADIKGCKFKNSTNNFIALYLKNEAIWRIFVEI